MFLYVNLVGVSVYTDVAPWIITFDDSSQNAVVYSHVLKLHNLLAVSVLPFISASFQFMRPTEYESRRESTSLSMYDQKPLEVAATRAR